MPFRCTILASNVVEHSIQDDSLGRLRLTLRRWLEDRPRLTDVRLQTVDLDTDRPVPELTGPAVVAVTCGGKPL